MTHRIVYGSIERDGSPRFGAGFNVRRESKGEYVITFHVAFKRPPAIVATAEHAEEKPRKVLNVVLDKQTDDGRSAVILVQTPDGKPNDNRFSFVAVAAL